MALPWWLPVLALAALPAAAPYFGTNLPRTNDALPHLYRTLALDRLIRQGILWPRWSPDLVHGFGYPVFNFFPILSHGSVELFHLVGLPLTTAYRVTIAAQFILAAWFTFLLVRDWFGPAAGWVAALVYIYSPYMLYDAHVRGGLPESTALVVLPLLLWALYRAIIRSGRWMVALALAFAAAILSHFPIAYQFLLPIGLLTVFSALRADPYQLAWHRTMGRVLVGLGLGALLTAFFWLPALMEVQYVRADLSISQGYSYNDNFLPVSDLVAQPRLPADPTLLNPPVVRALPVVALVWAFAAVVSRWRYLETWTKRQIGLWLTILMLSSFLVTEASRVVWEWAPLLKLTLYPWRFLGGASLAGAVLAAAPLSGLTRLHSKTFAALIIPTSFISIAAIPWLYPPREAVPESPTMADVIAFEQPPFLIGTTTLGEFLPRWVEELPEDETLRNRLASGQRLDRLVVSDNVTAQQLDEQPLGGATYRVDVAAPSTLTYQQFYFPGWRATLDGRPLALRPSEPHGLIQFDLPSGEHILSLTFGSTGPRRLGWALSGLGLLGLVVIWTWAGRQATQRSQARLGPLSLSQTARPSQKRYSMQEIISLFLLAGLILGLKLFFDTVDTPLRRPTLSSEGLVAVSGLTESSTMDLIGELRLLGYTQSTAEIPADGSVELTLYWQPLRDIGLVYDVSVRLIRLDDQHHLVWNRGDAQRPSDWRFAPGTDQWPRESYVMDPYLLSLLDGALPGEYAFRVGLVRRDTGETVADIQLGHLTVTRPGRGDRPLEDGMKPLSAFEVQGLSLLGGRIDRRQAAPGDPARVSLLWQVVDDATLLIDDHLTLNLVTAMGEQIVEIQATVSDGFPSYRWSPGDRLRSEILFLLPARIPDGIYHCQVKLADAMVEFGELEIKNPERTFEVPSVSHLADAEFSGRARLIGLDLPTDPTKSGDSLPVTLIWQGIAEMTVSYSVFLHLVGPDGTLVTQSDGVPVSWSRPTTGWLPGEIVRETRTLPIPDGLAAGVYELRVGLYDPQTSERLTLNDKNTFVSWTLQFDE